MQRDSCDQNGCFGRLLTPEGVQVAATAEHSYPNPDGSWYAKVPVGKYVCQYGVHELSVGPPFPTYQVMSVPGHTGILIHKGNLPEEDSEGCILLGQQLGLLGGAEAVLQSALAFQSFMNLQDGVQEFNLTVQ
jgi:hypothetical protein